MGSERGWTTPSELGEYAYCPRAAFYRRRWPDRAPTPEAVAGTGFHERALARERRVEHRGATYWAGVAIGALLLAGGLLAMAHP